MDGKTANANPTILDRSDLPTRQPALTPESRLSPIESTVPTYPLDPFTTSPSPLSSTSSDDATPDPIDAQEIYDLVANITDPEHPISLGELAVVNLSDITVHDAPHSPFSHVQLEFTPTVTHCHLATVIGLALVVRLRESLPARFRVDVRCKEGTHSTAEQLNKQLGDKERVVSAVENASLREALRKMMLSV
ncbi:hypothetical protein EX30DRAFT_338598 [Ascodesmis nigricans]|uniref:MIP18 family-like domain-containing protein n=1 Tax=Ascodesmis nigricans TaxID=341454 RepID=A0A4S2N450_9PEZI|nr:hypothetical protein EX30DRAFT_338598 [Ascodesmis nigricans]